MPGFYPSRFLIAKEERKEMPAPFYLAFEGKRGPKVPHDSVEEAMAEAQRLAEISPKKVGRRIFILETVAVHTIPNPKNDGTVNSNA